MDRYFQYSDKEIDYLKSRDKRLYKVIDRIGLIHRRAIHDIFAALVHSIIGQQISTLQSIGLSFRKVEYIRDAARRFESGEFDVNSFGNMTDAEIIEKLSQLKGVGGMECRDAYDILHATTRHPQFR